MVGVAGPGGPGGPAAPSAPAGPVGPAGPAGPAVPAAFPTPARYRYHVRSTPPCSSVIGWRGWGIFGVLATAIARRSDVLRGFPHYPPLCRCRGCKGRWRLGVMRLEKMLRGPLRITPMPQGAGEVTQMFAVQPLRARCPRTRAEVGILREEPSRVRWLCHWWKSPSRLLLPPLS